MIAEVRADLPGSSAVVFLRRTTGTSCSPGAGEVPAEARARDRPRWRRRPDQHPVHERHDRLSQGRDAHPPQHPQQRLLRRGGLSLHRGRPGLHPGAVLPLLRDGDGQPGVHHARRGDGHPGARLRARGDAETRARRSGAPPSTACRRCSSPSSTTRASTTFDLSSLRTGIMAGSPCPVEVMKRVIERMHMSEVAICYGMTETCPVSIQTASDDPMDKRVGSVGRVHPHVEVKIVDPETGATVARGDQRASCAPAATASCSATGTTPSGPPRRSTPTAGCTPATWPRWTTRATSTSSGRIKDMVIRGGENVYPARGRGVPLHPPRYRRRAGRSACPTRGTARS